MCTKDSVSEPTGAITDRLQMVIDDLHTLKTLISVIIVAGHHEHSLSSRDVSALFRQARSHISGAHEETSLALDVLKDLKQYSLL